MKKILISRQQLLSTVDFLAKNNKNFLNQQQLIFRAIFEGANELATSGYDNFATMGFHLRKTIYNRYIFIDIACDHFIYKNIDLSFHYHKNDNIELEKIGLLI